MRLGLGLGLSNSTGGGNTGPLDFVWYGQSNLLFHISNTGSAPTASAGTLVWDPGTSGWITPVGNGIITFLNSMAAASGRICRAVYGGQSGVNIADLQKGAGSGYYETLSSRITASGANPAFIIWHQGEGDGNTASPSISTYRTALDTFHGNITADHGKTRSSCRLICSSLATVTDPAFSQPNSSWQTIQDALSGINSSYANMHYSHSNLDATLTVPASDVHWTGPSYGRSGARYARTVQVLMGLASTRPNWTATAAERVTTTTTRITVTHSMGTDFTPTSGITGFEVSNDNGASWVSSTGARESATTLILTHSDLGTVERKIRYQFGKTPNVTAPVIDNGSLTAPLNFTSTDLVAAGAAALPVLTFASAAQATGSTVQTRTGVTVPGGSEELLAVIGCAMAAGSTGSTYSSCSVTAQPSGTVIAATLIVKQDSVSGLTDPGVAIYSAVIPTGTTSIDITLTMGANPFGQNRIAVSTIQTARLNSTTAYGSGVQRTATTTTATTTIATDTGGCAFVVGANMQFTSNGGSLSGTETYTVRAAQTNSPVVGDASNTAANASSTVTGTWATSQDSAIAAASWR
jgi:hypothetical protein